MNKVICPLCSSTKIVHGYQTRHAQMIPVDRGTFTKSSDVLADICGDCGCIISLKVRNPEYFTE